jgi:hypothetical protein
MLIIVLASAYRLGSGGILSPENRVQCPRCVAVLQGARTSRRFSGVRLQFGSVELWLHVRFDGVYFNRALDIFINFLR